ncbi:hypothetical protein QEG23_002060 [Stenotrophomonas maltophilia]|uniref:Uncharacterized protein n=1 Tax=Stenotrophomonas maltophilia TaxID=40324 RepID=A0AAI9FV70_STEMA|nr:hypothetical protein [Stenotrophomonas maltophilia]
MSAPVDVLAVLDTLCERAASGDPVEYREVNSLREAVSDLIAANKKIASIYGPASCSMRIGSERREAWGEFFAALFRAKGGAA